MANDRYMSLNRWQLQRDRSKTPLSFLNSVPMAPTMGGMSRETIRRRITIFLLVLLAAVALRGGEGKDVALVLGPIAALLVLAMRYYFA